MLRPLNHVLNTSTRSPDSVNEAQAASKPKIPSPARIPKELGGAHVTSLKSRPKLIGGERARYE